MARGEVGLYLMPFSARGTNKMMMMALKIMADKIADSGACQFHDI